MNDLYNKKGLRNEIGNLGREYIHNNLNPESIGKIIEKRLEQINQLNDYNEECNKQIQTVYQSHSWRITT